MNVDIGEIEVIRCRKCRKQLVDMKNTVLLTAHGEEVCADRFTTLCATDQRLMYLKEDNLPDWIMPKVEMCEWMRGKLHCNDCGAKLGAFDFVSNRRCECGKYVSPSVYLIKSQVDFHKAKIPQGPL